MFYACLCYQNRVIEKNRQPSRGGLSRRHSRYTSVDDSHRQASTAPLRAAKGFWLHPQPPHTTIASQGFPARFQGMSASTLLVKKYRGKVSGPVQHTGDFDPARRDAVENQVITHGEAEQPR